jgi:hypothetical protein
MITLSRAVQREKANEPILSKPSDNVRFVSEEQPLKALAPICVTVGGITILVSPEP